MLAGPLFGGLRSSRLSGFRKGARVGSEAGRVWNLGKSGSKLKGRAVGFEVFELRSEWGVTLGLRFESSGQVGFRVLSFHLQKLWFSSSERVLEPEISRN